MTTTATRPGLGFAVVAAIFAVGVAIHLWPAGRVPASPLAAWATMPAAWEPSGTGARLPADQPADRGVRVQPRESSVRPQHRETIAVEGGPAVVADAASTTLAASAPPLTPYAGSVPSMAPAREAASVSRGVVTTGAALSNAFRKVGQGFSRAF